MQHLGHRELDLGPVRVCVVHRDDEEAAPRARRLQVALRAAVPGDAPAGCTPRLRPGARPRRRLRAGLGRRRRLARRDHACYYRNGGGELLHVDSFTHSRRTAMNHVVTVAHAGRTVHHHAGTTRRSPVSVRAGGRRARCAAA